VSSGAEAFPKSESGKAITIAANLYAAYPDLVTAGRFVKAVAIKLTRNLAPDQTSS